MRKADFFYELPRSLIAQAPLPERDQSRLLHVRAQAVAHRRFRDLPALLVPGDLLVVNDSKVINARLRGIKDSGGAVEIIVERIETNRVALCQVRASKSLKSARCLYVTGGRLVVVDRPGEFYRLEFPTGVADFLERYGETPLPPYIDRAAGADDRRRYQTLYAAKPGAVAAPTAGLHFSERLFAALAERGVQVAKITLHVGAGTFQPVREDDLARHRMHSEHYEIPDGAVQSMRACRKAGHRVVAVGTTVVRALETAARHPEGIGARSGETRLFIRPGHRFRAVDALLTNFHLPESTLLMLVCAFAGFERVMAAYADAVRERYRFFSYGDAMFTECYPDV